MSDVQSPALPPLPDWLEPLMPSAVRVDPPAPSNDPFPRMVPVKSSNIAACAHDGIALWVRFLNGGVYRYPTAGTDLHAGMIAAESPGRFFLQHIKLHHDGVKVA